ncbi:mechanosensitive ion channel family protein [Sorangium atrum]|uniref:Mechanosensitive ion channel n=1 Tax=Sorangium atrum TaxID=2995308 RepID=A0ABT5BTA2_9BACT|nr:mechanosensitive ion channel domain-containing protein [Sorangium aterium]MDC0677398.1 mechanosensitive ion channel [Sorangium aterium]
MNLDRLPALWADLIRSPASLPVALALSASVLALGFFAYRLVFASLSRLAGATQTSLDDLLVRRMRLPARMLVALLAMHAFISLRGGELPTLHKGVLLLELTLAAYLAIEIAETLIIDYWLAERRKVLLPALVRHLLLTILYLVAGLSIVGAVTGVDLVPLLATSTVITVVLGLALQDTLGNLFAGLALHSERSFGVGDWILVDGVEGQVIYVGWRSTRLRTFSGDVVILPNSIIAKARVQNFCAPDRNCARNIEMLVALGASPEAVERAAQRACGEVPEVLREPAPRLWLASVTPLFQRYVIKFWIADFERHDLLESEVMKAFFRACRDEGVALSPAAAQPALAVEIRPPAGAPGPAEGAAGAAAGAVGPAADPRAAPAVLAAIVVAPAAPPPDAHL